MINILFKKRICGDVHYALNKIYHNDIQSIPGPVINKLHLMGFIMPELDNRWLLTSEGKAYLTAADPHTAISHF